MYQHDHYRDHDRDSELGPPRKERTGVPGRRTVTSGLTAPLLPVQLKASLRFGSAEAFPVYGGGGFDSQLMPEDSSRGVADVGVAGATTELPHQAALERSFGAHSVAGISAHVGGAASHAAEQLGAVAYATGDHVAFAEAPDLHTTAHEVAHVLQQRAGVQLKAGRSAARDHYEDQADAVGDLVVRGQSAERLLDEIIGQSTGGSNFGSAVQLKAMSHHHRPTSHAPGPSGDEVLEISVRHRDARAAASTVHALHLRPVPDDYLYSVTHPREIRHAQDTAQTEARAVREHDIPVPAIHPDRAARLGEAPATRAYRDSYPQVELLKQANDQIVAMKESRLAKDVTPKEVGAVAQIRTRDDEAAHGTVGDVADLHQIKDQLEVSRQDLGILAKELSRAFTRQRGALAQLRLHELEKRASRAQEDVAATKERSFDKAEAVERVFDFVGKGLKLVSNLVEEPLEAAGEGMESAGALLALFTNDASRADLERAEDTLSALHQAIEIEHERIDASTYLDAVSNIQIALTKLSAGLAHVEALLRQQVQRYAALGMSVGRATSGTLGKHNRMHREIEQIPHLEAFLAASATVATYDLHSVDNPAVVAKDGTSADAAFATWMKGALPSLGDAVAALVPEYRHRLGEARKLVGAAEGGAPPGALDPDGSAS